MSTTQIQVTACDNELILIAIPSTADQSFNLLHYNSGYDKPVDVTLYPGATLPTGDYTLSMIGINWGGVSAYSVTVTTDGVASVYTGGGNNDVGPNWTNNIPIRVVSGQ